MEYADLAHQVKAIRNALINLYLTVKIQQSSELKEFAFKEDHSSLQGTDPLLLINYIRASIEILIKAYTEERDSLKNQSNDSMIIKEKSQAESKYNELLQHLESEVRMHIRTEQQLKLYFDEFQEKQEKDQRELKKQHLKIQKLGEENKKMRTEMNELKDQNGKLKQDYKQLEVEFNSYKASKAKESVISPNVGKSAKFISGSNEYLQLLRQMSLKEDSIDTSQCTERIETVLESKQKPPFTSIKQQSTKIVGNAVVSSNGTNIKTPNKNKAKPQSRQKARGSSCSTVIKTERALCNSTKLNSEISSAQKQTKGILKRQFTQTIDSDKLSLGKNKAKTKNLLKSKSKIITRRENCAL